MDGDDPERRSVGPNEPADGDRGSGASADGGGGPGTSADGGSGPGTSADGGSGVSSSADTADESHSNELNTPENPDINDLLAKLDSLRDVVDDEHEREKVRQTISLVEQMPGSAAFRTRITKYTSRDMAEAFVGSVLFALPLLVEGGVFEIATWFATTTPGGVPVFLLLHVAFVLVMTAGLLYFADFRQIEISHPILGVVPRRYVGILLVSLFTTVLMLMLWGRLHEGDPTALERVSRVAFVWAGAAFGASLGDILPGESKGTDIKNLDLELKFDRDD